MVGARLESLDAAHTHLFTQMLHTGTVASTVAEDQGKEAVNYISLVAVTNCVKD